MKDTSYFVGAMGYLELSRNRDWKYRTGKQISQARNTNLAVMHREVKIKFRSGETVQIKHREIDEKRGL